MTDTTTVKPETCDHPESERFTHDFGPHGYLNTPKGERILCGGCGADMTEASSPALAAAVAAGLARGRLGYDSNTSTVFARCRHGIGGGHQHGRGICDGPATEGNAVYPCTVCGGNVKVHARDINFDEGDVTGGYVHFGCIERNDG